MKRSFYDKLVPAIMTVALLVSCSGKFTPFTFVHCTDTQIGFIDSTDGYVHSDSLMRDAFTAINALRPEFVFVTGDLVDDVDDPLQNTIFEKGMATLEAPYYLVPGNHDYKKQWTKEIRDGYVSLRGYERFSFSQHGCAFIGIDSNCIKENAEEAEAEQFAWLESELRKARKARYTFLFLHCPIFKQDIGETEDYENFPIEKREKYISLLKEYGVDAVLAGHTHKDYDTEYEGIRLVAANPICNALGHGRPGFNVVRVDKDGFDIKIVPTPGIDPEKCHF
ncbi:MAG: metallophosphoesterase [Bacteroidales bacterium]|nr:metallophosphoesterase [Bacteroidales bacterium]